MAIIFQESFIFYNLSLIFSIFSFDLKESLLRCGKVDEAEILLCERTNFTPTDAQSWRRLASVYGRRGQRDDVRNQMTREWIFSRLLPDLNCFFILLMSIRFFLLPVFDLFYISSISDHRTVNLSMLSLVSYLVLSGQSCQLYRLAEWDRARRVWGLDMNAETLLEFTIIVYRIIFILSQFVRRSMLWSWENASLIIFNKTIFTEATLP